MAVTIYVVQTLLRDTPRGSDRRLEPSLAAAVSMPRWLFANLLNAGLGGGTMRLYRYRVGGRGFESELPRPRRSSGPSNGWGAGARLG